MITDPFEGKDAIASEDLAAAMQNDLVGRTVAKIRIVENRVLIIFDTGQELEFTPDGVHGMRYQTMDVN